MGLDHPLRELGQTDEAEQPLSHQFFAGRQRITGFVEIDSLLVVADQYSLFLPPVE
jgi:hypothetical protein